MVASWAMEVSFKIIDQVIGAINMRANKAKQQLISNFLIICGFSAKPDMIAYIWQS